MNKFDNPIVLPYLVGMGIGKDFEAPVVNLINLILEQCYGEIPVWDINHFTTDHLTAENYESEMAKVETFVRKYGYAIKGPFHIASGLPSINVYLRKRLDLYACVRPVSWIPGVPSPVKHPENVNVVIFRENTEDLYSGIGFLPGTPDAEELGAWLLSKGKVPPSGPTGYAIKTASKEASERIMRSAIEYALKHGNKKVTIVAKHNIDKAADQYFRKWCLELAEKEYAGRVFTVAMYDAIAAKVGEQEANDAWNQAEDEGKILIDTVITDDSLQQFLIRPKNYEVIVTPNMTGDLLSDFFAAQVGGLGVAPGVNINYETGIALFEATHGTWPKGAGKGIANPISLLLSFAMMFDYLQLRDAASLLRASIKQAVKDNQTTFDIYRKGEGLSDSSLSTEEFCDVVGKLMPYIIY